MNGESIWDRVTDNRLIKEKSSKSWIIATMMFGFVAMMAGYLPMFLAYIADTRYILDESKFFLSFNTMSVMLDWYGNLVMLLLLYGAITFMIDWAKPWIEKHASEPEPREVGLMPKKGDDAWL